VATIATVFFSGKFYLNFFLVIVTCALIDFATYSYHTLFTNNLAGALMILVKERGLVNEKIDLPPIIAKVLKKYDVYKKLEGDNNNYIESVDNVSRMSSYRDLALKEKEPSNVAVQVKVVQMVQMQKMNPYFANGDEKNLLSGDVVHIENKKL
jgi:hypothetical protein